MSETESALNEGSALSANFESMASAFDLQFNDWFSWSREMKQTASNSIQEISSASGLILSCLDGTAESLSATLNEAAHGGPNVRAPIKIISMSKFAARKRVDAKKAV